jgi:hypothetical protein
MTKQTIKAATAINISIIGSHRKFSLAISDPCTSAVPPVE